MVGDPLNTTQGDHQGVIRTRDVRHGVAANATCEMRTNDPFLSPEAASLDVVYIHQNVNRALWVRGNTATGPVLTSAFLAFLPGDAVFPAAASSEHLQTPVSPEGSHGGGSQSPSAGYFDVFEPLASLRQAVPPRGSWAVESTSSWGPKMHVAAQTEVGGVKLPSVVGVYRDTRLYRHGDFPGCDAGANDHCLLALVRLPLAACNGSHIHGGVPAERTLSPISWTCTGLVETRRSADFPREAREATDLNAPACIRVVTGTSLAAISGYAAEALKRPFLRSVGSAGALLQFCGAPLPQLISVDVIAGRVFFVQRSSVPTAARRLSDADSGEGLNVDFPGVSAAASEEKSTGDGTSEGGVPRGIGGETPGNRSDDASLSPEALDTAGRRLSRAAEGEGLASLCVAYAYLDGFYDDVSQCLPVVTESEGSDALGDPVYLQVDPFAAGDDEPYKNRIDVIDVSTGFHERIDMPSS
ncbi:uncharacterized protein LOC34619572 [Cyclospora cayetanensis]|uniref:Uncharacterized protein LOC34619572 n=1 Tax=Cyclospora cayetanensis TaxID=88456 RepID=A0A6P6S0A4_9EIME|nr:uncharacterized protein LOC34619572 [Cyclospora cayetanensis]